MKPVQANKIKDHTPVNPLFVSFTPTTEASKNNNLAHIMLNFFVLRLQVCYKKNSLLNCNFDIFLWYFLSTNLTNVHISMK